MGHLVNSLSSVKFSFDFKKLFANRFPTEFVDKPKVLLFVFTIKKFTKIIDSWDVSIRFHRFTISFEEPPIDLQLFVPALKVRYAIATTFRELF